MVQVEWDMMADGQGPLPALWSAEEPNLYYLVLTLRAKDGSIIECESCQVRQLISSMLLSVSNAVLIMNTSVWNLQAEPCLSLKPSRASTHSICSLLIRIADLCQSRICPCNTPQIRLSKPLKQVLFHRLAQHGCSEQS